MKNPNNPYAYRSGGAVDYDDDEDEDNDFDDNEENADKSFAQNGNIYNSDSSKRHPKKRKLESFVSNHEFAPRSEGWSEDESFVLLEVWGERYMELGRRSLRAEDWVDVKDKVAEMSGSERTEAECRSQLDVLKNKYKKEMAKVESGNVSKWVFFKKMDALLNLRTRGYGGLGCGLDSGEYVFMNPRVYLDRSNVLDEMRDSPGQSDEDNEDDGDGDDDEEDLGGDGLVDAESARLLADSIQKFGEIYEKIEESKRRQMVELETMRQDFQRELELQKKQIVDRAQAEIAKLRAMDDDDDENTDTSVENFGD
ncbi:Alcohol dehydrogenase transcription factor Myb/SANT-like family protein [Perilla frutescens var. frutescens]|nr:Alcohol dehydrogenase transcription factor Myb/SANT-like family protein [Perilla frutescens var. frutescens]